MSRTDKTMPPWVAAEWWAPYHWGCEYSFTMRWQERPRGVPCDLPDVPVRQYPNPQRYGRRTNCCWDFVWPYGHGRRSYRHGGVPKWFVDHVWNGPERLRERDDLRELRDEYNTHGELEDGDFPCWQTRGYARWMWD